MTRRRLLLLAPLGAVAVGAGAFWTVLRRMEEGRFDPRGVPSALVGKPVPAFDLPAQPSPAQASSVQSLDGGEARGFSGADLLAAGRPVLVNFFASWCVPCVIEHPQLMALAREGLPIWGIAYKDKPEAAAAFLARRGNPFTRLARDAAGQVALDWGVYGVPESYLVDSRGVIRWRYAGPLTPEVVEDQVRPLLRAMA